MRFAALKRSKTSLTLLLGVMGLLALVAALFGPSALVGLSARGVAHAASAKLSADTQAITDSGPTKICAQGLNLVFCLNEGIS
jgi:hypothetical protein